MDLKRKLPLLLRSLLTAALSALLLLHLAVCAGKFADGRVDTSSAEETAAAFRFPAITACGVGEEEEEGEVWRSWLASAAQRVIVGNGESKTKASFKIDRHDSKLESLIKLGINASSLWQENILLDSQEEDGKSRSCSTFVPPADSAYGIPNQLVLHVNRSRISRHAPFLYVSASHPGMAALPFNLLGSSELLLTVPLLRIAREWLMAFQFGEYRSLNRDEKPCLEGAKLGGDLKKCIMDRIRIGCIGNGSCSSEALDPLREISARMYGSGGAKVLSELGCSAPCRFPTYGLSLVSSIDAVSEEEDVAILRFYAPVPIKTVRTEHLVYDWTSLSGDVGGMMGLLLGLSVLAIYDGALELGGHASSPWSKRGGDRRSETSVQDGRNVE